MESDRLGNIATICIRTMHIFSDFELISKDRSYINQ